MVIPSTKFKLQTLLVFLNGVKLEYVNSYKYQCMFIHVRNDDLDIVRQLKRVILRTNNLDEDIFIIFCRIKTIFVSRLLFQLLPTVPICGTILRMNKLRITCNNAMRRQFNLHFRCSASEMFANCNIHSMAEIRRKCIYNFIQRLKCSSNAIITCFMSSTFIQKCAIWNHWFKCLYLHMQCFLCNI